MASYTRTNHVEEFGVPSSSRRRANHLSGRTGPTASRGSTCSGRSTRAADCRRSRGRLARRRTATGQDREDGASRSQTGNHPRVSGRSSPRALRSTSCDRHWNAPTRTSSTCGISERRPGSAERRAVDRGAAGASANAADRGGEHRRDDVGRISTAGRSRAGHAVRSLHRQYQCESARPARNRRSQLLEAAGHARGPRQPAGAKGSGVPDRCRGRARRGSIGRQLACR